MYKKLIVLSLLSLLQINVFAQTSSIDSLEDQLRKHVSIDSKRVNMLNMLANSYVRIDVSKTLLYATEADSLSSLLGYSNGQAESLRLIGVYHRLKSDYAKALEFYSKSLKIALDLGDSKAQMMCYNNFGSVYFAQGDYSQALEYFGKSLSIAEKENDKNAISMCFNNMGLIYYSQGNYTKALEFFNKTLEIKEETGERGELSVIYNNMGLIYYYQGDYPRALEYFQKSLPLKEGSPDKSGIAMILNNIGNIYYSQEDYLKALDYYQQSLILREEIGNKEGLSMSYNNIGLIYFTQANYAKALEFYEKTLSISQEIGDKRRMASVYNNIGHIYFVQKKHTKAHEFYSKGLALSIEIGSKSLETWSYVRLGQMLNSLQKHQEAYRYGINAYSLAQEIGEKELIKESAEVISTSCAEMGLFKKAFEYHRVYVAMNDSLRNEENTKRILNLEFEYRFEKEKELAQKEKEKREVIHNAEILRQKSIRNSFILGFALVAMMLSLAVYSFLLKRKANSLLTAQKQEIMQKNVELKTLNTTKDKFFRIIAHDLKNPFNVMLGFTELMIEKLEKKIFDEALTFARLLFETSAKAYELLDNLLTWSRSQSGVIQFKPTNLDIKKTLDYNVLLLATSAKMKGVSLSSLLTESRWVYADNNMLLTVMRNLTTNAIKFTKSGDSITLNAIEEGDHIVISVSDTGVGIPEDSLEKLFRIEGNVKTQGTANEQGTGLGLVLCKEFVNHNQGDIWVRSKEGQGTCFYFSLPKGVASRKEHDATIEQNNS